MKTKTLLGITIALLLLLVCRAATVKPEPKLSDVAAGYTKLNRMTPKRHFISNELSAMCSVPDPKWIKKTYGPHAFTSIHVFMNDSARDAFKAGTAYPVGSVIVKEKTPDETNKDHATYLGGMVRRTASAKSSVNDWEFFYVREGEKPFPDPLTMQSCRDCHESAAKTGFVFGTWAKYGNVKKGDRPPSEKSIK
jgi:hypothetical protein